MNTQGSTSALSKNIKRLIASLGLLGLAACQSEPSGFDQLTVADFDYRKRHPILITEAPENFDIPVAGATRNLNRSMKTAIAAFGQQSGAEGSGFVEVLVPSGSANEAAVRSITPSIREALKAGGVAGERIVMRTYAVSDIQASAPVRLSFMRMKAKVQNCGNWPDGMVTNTENVGTYNFGCSYQANLAAVIDNPADLLRPRPLGPRDPERAVIISKNAREGKVTASAAKEGVGARVSDVQ